MKRGRSPSSQMRRTNNCSKMEQKMALVRQRIALFDSGSSGEEDCVPLSIRAITLMNERKNLVVSQKSATVDDGKKNTNYPSTEDRKSLSQSNDEKKLPIFVAQQPLVVDDYDDIDWPLSFRKITRVESKQRKLPAVPQTHDTQNTNTGLTNTTKVSSVNGQRICASVKSTVEDNSQPAMKRALEVQAKLSPEHPCIVKSMLQSHVVRSFWLGLPTEFCNKHLPKHDTGVVLEDENGNKYDVTYLGHKRVLSAGWRGFSIKHDIRVGDVVVFQLVSPTKFKVYIIRGSDLSTTDGALGPLSLDQRAEGNRSEGQHFNGVERLLQSKECGKFVAVSSKVSRSNNNDLVSDMMDGIGFSDSDVPFDDVRTFDDFNIIVDGLVMDRKFPGHLRTTYYELCCSQKSFLHKHLLKGLNLTLIVGVIMETINISEGIRACKVCNSSCEDLLIWKKTLEAFERLGMNVAFLLQRLNKLLGLAFQVKEASGCDKYKEVKLERARAAENMKALEFKLLKIKDALKKLDVEMEETESGVKNNDLKLQQIASAPW